MPHLGTQPPTGFKTTTKQSFSGDNSTTAFTLNGDFFFKYRLRDIC